MSDPVELLFDAFEAADVGFYDRDTGVVDMQAADIASALIAAGWTPPASEPDSPERPPTASELLGFDLRASGYTTTAERIEDARP